LLGQFRESGVRLLDRSGWIEHLDVGRLSYWTVVGFDPDGRGRFEAERFDIVD